MICVTGPPSIGRIAINKVCATSLSISWDTDIHPVCGVRAQLVTISSSSSAARTFDATDNNFTFTDLNSTTSYDVTITLRYKRNQLTTRNATIVTSLLHRKSGRRKLESTAKSDSYNTVQCSHNV